MGRKSYFGQTSGRLFGAGRLLKTGSLFENIPLCELSIFFTLKFSKFSMFVCCFIGYSALHVATLQGSKHLVGTILDMGADINDQVT